MAAVVAALSMSLAIAASASASSSLGWRGNLTDAPLAPALSFTGPVAWGENTYGQLGDGKSGSENSSNVPVALSGLGEVVALAGGERHSLALVANGTVLAWGYNGQGQLGNGTTTNSNVPVKVSVLTEVTAISAGDDFSLALLKNGTVMSWGNDEFGRLGDGKSGSANNSDVPVQVSGLTEVTAISAGGTLSLALLKNGTVMSWGYDGSGQLGDGLSGLKQQSDVPVPVSSLTGVASIAAGWEQSLAVLGSGAVMAWGRNEEGELGVGSASGPETCPGACAKKPVPVSGLTEATAVGGGKYFSLALQRSGAVVAWGSNQYGQLGDGVTEGPERCPGGEWCSTKPVPVSGLTEAVAISAGGWSGYARLKAGAIAAWGSVLGNGTNGSATCNCSRTPVLVDGLSGTTAISGGESHALALGTLAPIPTITSVEPNNGPAAGGTSVTITGTQLSEVTAVKFGSTTATSFKVESETKISAISPPGVGVVDVTVATPNATSGITSADHFDYAPTVTHVEPNNGPTAGGTSVTITGTNFNQVSAVKFGATNATSFTVNSASSITAVSPAGTGLVDVTVTTAGGTSPTSEADHFTFGPTVTAVSPGNGRGSGGTSVTITGAFFTGATAVKFGPTNATSFTVNSASSITAVSPAGTGLVDVTVTTAGGTSPTSEADRFDYRPSVSRVAPTNGPQAGGTTVEIVGANLNEVNAVKFGSTNATSFTVNSETSITAVSPAGAGTVEVTVTTSGGTSVASPSFTYVFNAHYYSNGAKLKESEGKVGEAGVKEMIGWGTIHLKGLQGPDIKCRNVIAGDVWNPIGGGTGKGMTQAWAVFDCETTLCAEKTVVNVAPENLPWPGELQGGTGLAKTNTIRSHSEHVKMDLTCNGASTAHFQGSYQPGAAAGEDKGTSPAHPGFLEFDQPGSGELEEVELAGAIFPTGTVRELGYAEQELIQAK